MKSIKFLVDLLPYRAHEITALRSDIADNLITTGKAVEVTDKLVQPTRRSFRVRAVRKG